MNRKIYPIILSGGSGTRLWPISREAHPKPFVHLADGQSLLQKTFLRAARLPDVSEIMTVTNREHYFKTDDDYRQVNSRSLPLTYVLEPFGRNTAAAVATSALRAANTHGDDIVLLVLAADHIVANEAAFNAAVNHASMLAAQGYLVTFGVKPNYPETAYGYIEADRSPPLVAVEPHAYRVARFAEKPGIEDARKFLLSGRYLWNSGIFCFKAGTVVAELGLHAPVLLDMVRHCLEVSGPGCDDKSCTIELDATTFKAVPEVSIDYALMEKSTNAAVIACNFGWSDIGSWNRLGDLIAPDQAGNRVSGDVLLEDVRDCYIRGAGRLIAGLGVDNLVVVDTPDALLIAKRDRAQDVRQVVSRLKQNGHEAYRLHRTVHRPWGTYTVIEEGERYKIKRINVKPGASLSLQMHHHRSEHWVVVSGTAHVVNGEKSFFLNVNESTFIPAGHKHRLENPGIVDLAIIEVQSGDYLGEDDIVRFEDNYDRA